MTSAAERAIDGAVWMLERVFLNTEVTEDAEEEDGEEGRKTDPPLRSG
jgi:hypothetical protein